GRSHATSGGRRRPPSATRGRCFAREASWASSSGANTRSVGLSWTSTVRVCDSCLSSTVEAMKTRGPGGEVHRGERYLMPSALEQLLLPAECLLCRNLLSFPAPAAPAPGAVLVPIPLGARRLRERGYNQSEHLARALGARWSLPVRADLLARRRETTTQTALTPVARLANVAGAFEARNMAASALVLVDDVFTTGATLAEAARALSQAGAVRITAVTFGRAAIPDFT